MWKKVPRTNAVFIIIYDIANTIRHSHTLLYADDIKLYKEIKTKEESELLQQDLDKLANWSIVLTIQHQKM